MGHVQGTRRHEHASASNGAVSANRDEQALDDWLGDVSDEDWSDPAARRSTANGARGAGTPVEASRAAQSEWPPDPSRGHERADARRAAIERRRYTAGLVVIATVALAVGVAVLLLRGGDGGVTPVGDGTATAPTETSGATAPTATTGTESAAPTETGATSPTTPSTTTTTSPSTTAPSTSASAFSLPEGTKLQRGEGDPVLVEQLQRALLAAGYDPGAADGTFGRLTEAAVVAFQQAHGLSVDGRVGPETAAALSAAVASG